MAGGGATTAPLCGICGVRHWMRDPHVWSGSGVSSAAVAERGAGGPPATGGHDEGIAVRGKGGKRVSARPAALPDVEAVESDQDAVIADLRAELIEKQAAIIAELRAENAALRAGGIEARREADRLRQIKRREKAKGAGPTD